MSNDRKTLSDILTFVLSNGVLINSLSVPFMAAAGVVLIKYASTGVLNWHFAFILFLAATTIVAIIFAIALAGSMAASRFVDNRIQSELDTILSRYRSETDKIRHLRQLLDNRIFLPHAKNADDTIYELERNALAGATIRILTPDLANDDDTSENKSVIELVKLNAERGVFYEFYLPKSSLVSQDWKINGFRALHAHDLQRGRIKLYALNDDVYQRFAMRHAMSLVEPSSRGGAEPHLFLEMPVRLSEPDDLEIWMKSDAKYSRDWHSRFFGLVVTGEARTVIS